MTELALSDFLCSDVSLPWSMRAVALGAAVAVFAGQLAASAHEENEHVVCPEHGELIHAESAAVHSALGWTGQRDLPEHHDVHCGGELLLPTSESKTPIVVRQPAQPVLVAGVQGALSVPPIGILSLAPKSSPPLA